MLVFNLAVLLLLVKLYIVFVQYGGHLGGPPGGSVLP